MKSLYKDYADIWHCHNRSGHLKRIKKVVKSRLDSIGADYHSDNYGNIIVGNFDAVKPCMVAHLDSVHSKGSRAIYFDGDRLSSDNGIGADDKCGIISALECLRDCDINAVFTVDEEIGCIGADKLDKRIFDKTCFFIEVDRRGNDEVINNLCYPKSTSAEFEQELIPYMENYKLKFGEGTFTDLSEIIPEVKIAGINLCAGYYEAHTVKEYVILSELHQSIEFCKAVFNGIRDRFEIEVDSYGGYGYGSTSGFNFLTDDINDCDSIGELYECMIDLYGQDDLMFEAIKRAYELGMDEANKPIEYAPLKDDITRL
jgi:di/tripeptidase